MAHYIRNLSCLICLFLLWITPLSGYAQIKYWVFLTDKGRSEAAISQATLAHRQQQELPVNQWTDQPLKKEYLQTVSEMGIDVVCQSRWFNAFTAQLTPLQLQQVQQLPFVDSTTPVDIDIRMQPLAYQFTEDLHYSTAIRQMDAQVLTDRQLNGKGIAIGIIDAGFWNAHESDYLTPLFEKQQVRGYKDLLRDEDPEDFFNKKYTSSDGHGTQVLRMIAGKKDGALRYGLADQATFYLARTDHGDREFRGEEDYWIAALEWMDSLGVQIVNTSLGYTLGFDNPNENYRPSQMNGSTALITKAAEIAATQKGMLIIVSAGNEGNTPGWRIISAPADAQHVLSVGATTDKGLKAGYSSIGPEFLPYLKPNVSCYSRTGTSFSAPVISGLAACLMQYKPEAIPEQLFEAIEASATLYPYGNNYIGYGIPQAGKALELLDGKKVEEKTVEEKHIKRKKTITLKGLGQEMSVAILFHKKDEYQVYRQSAVRVYKGKLKINRPRKAVRTTVVHKGKVTEIFWE